jgi:hypothetical protein
VPPPGSELSPSCSSPPRPARPPQGIPANSTRSHSPPALRPRAPRPRAHATLPCHRPCSPMTSRSTLGPPSRGRSLPTPPSRWSGVGPAAAASASKTSSSGPRRCHARHRVALPVLHQAVSGPPLHPAGNSRGGFDVLVREQARRLRGGKDVEGMQPPWRAS